MNPRQTTAALCAVALLALTSACGNEDPESPSGTPTAQPTETTSPGIAPGEPVPAKLEAAPGRIGRVEVGMTKKEALATGYFDADVKVGGDTCPTTVPLQWKKDFAEWVDVFTGDDGTIASLGVFKNVRTAKDVGIGSTLGDVMDAYGDDVSPAMEAGYGQAGVYVTEGDKWLGFLVNEEFAAVTPESEITFMEVSVGRKPDLMRDGC